MPYCSLQDVEKAAGGSARLAAFADYDGDGVADVGVVDDVIAEADAEINSYANKRFSVPFSPVPDSIRRRSARLSAYYLAANRTMLTQTLQTRYESDMKWLEDLASGKVLPGTEPIPPKGEIVNDTVGERDSTKTVSREKTKGFW